MKNEVASLMNDEKLMKIFAVAKINRNYSLFTIHYSLFITCQGSVPEAIVCFLEARNFEDAVRNAISLGGDADTQGAIAGSIAEAYFGVPIQIEDKVMEYLTPKLRTIYYAFNKIKGSGRKT